MELLNGGLSNGQAWVITGPTSGIGRRTALELAKHGTRHQNTATGP